MSPVSSPSPASLGHLPTCPSTSAPEVPQAPVPVPQVGPPDWSRMLLASISGGFDAWPLMVGGAVGEPQGYATWVDAVAAARVLSGMLGRAVAVLDHQGRLYLRTLDVPAAFPWVGMGRPYVAGTLGEMAIDFNGPAMRGIVQGDEVLSRGDCLVPRVLVTRGPRHAGAPATC